MSLRCIQGGQEPGKQGRGDWGLRHETREPREFPSEIHNQERSEKVCFSDIAGRNSFSAFPRGKQERRKCDRKSIFFREEKHF